MKILFTSVGRRVELMQAYRKAAEEGKFDVEIIGADISDTAPALFFCDKTVIVPRISDEKYIPFLFQYCKDNKVDALIPTIDTDLLMLAKAKEDFAKVGTRVMIANPNKVALCRDKRLTAEYFSSLGLHTPMPVDDYKQYSGGFPAFIKPKDGSSSINAFKVNSKEELEAYAIQVPDYIIQPFVTGTEYTVDVFCDFDGSPIYITPRIRLATRTGEVLKTQIDEQTDIVEEIKTILRDFRPSGAATIQLIRCDGINNYIEINPRYGGGAPLSIKAGANSPLAMLKLLAGEKLEYIPGAAENGAVYSRFDQSIRVK